MLQVTINRQNECAKIVVRNRLSSGNKKVPFCFLKQLKTPQETELIVYNLH